ncbi:von Willebrand factor A domain-containing protein 5A-like isoform X1 [Mauremys reevesii]|uniref:von Willebrand factor A domain-containing protein 5A-like isoform X1 n=2 Tax=Mauremys reevesii TaxID=260615 RepID=UPI00193FE089|nr:von Willebrand factor A domain-containing protein 5A-like isoform X1 [Mauremys reevesii]XP_039355486.1 von Willebrand factor A domain-containing protein 5A-like isoform X1 [Mauremys reevesii]
MRSCGLLNSSNKPVPLRSGSVTVLIRGFVADVGCELLYRNDEQGPVEAVFVFPVDAEAAVYAFQARLGGACIQAQLREKKQAQEMYGDALAGGQSSFLLQQEGAGGDVFSCSLGNLPPGEEAALTLRYVCELPLEPDGAARYMLPAVLRPRYTPHGWDGEDVTQGVPRVPQGELPYTLSLSATLQSPHGIDRVLSNCSLTPLSYTAGNWTSAQVSLAEAPPWGRDVELLVYYAEPHKPSAVLELGLPGAEPGSLMGDPAVMVTLLPSLPEAVPGQSPSGEFIFLLDRSGSMRCPIDGRDRSPQRIDSAKETLVLLLKSLPLGCYFNIYGFGSRFESFYPQSVAYTQQTMAESLQRIQQLQADLGGTEILAPLRAIYRSPCRDGHPRQLFVFTDGEVGNTKDVITEVQRHQRSHRCFSFGIGEGASTALVKGIARAAGGSAEFITGQDRMQPKALQSLKRALQPAVTGISLSWDLPPGMEAALLGRGPEVIFPGQRCLIYAQLRGQPQPPDTAVGGVSLQYRIQDQTYKETLQFPLQPQDGDRLPVHRLAAKSLLLELEGAVDTGSEGDRCRALETSLSSGVVCSLTAYVGVDTERGQPVQEPLVRRDIPLAAFGAAPRMRRFLCSSVGHSPPVLRAQAQGLSSVSVDCAMACNLQVKSCRPPVLLRDTHPQSSPRAVGALFSPGTAPPGSLVTLKRSCGSPRHEGRKSCTLSAPPETASKEERAPEVSPLLRLVSLQNADGSWDLDPRLAAALGVSETDARGRMPSQDVPPGIWATVLAVVWLHGRAVGQRDEWELLEAKAVGWLRGQAGPRLSECLEAANTLLGCSVGPAVFGL